MDLPPPPPPHKLLGSNISADTDPIWIKLETKSFGNIYNRLQLSPQHLSRQHLSWGHLSISAISQLLLARFGSNFKQRVLGTYTTDYNFHHICPCNICPWDNCPYQQYKYFQAEHFRLQSCFDLNFWTQFSFGSKLIEINLDKNFLDPDFFCPVNFSDFIFWGTNFSGQILLNIRISTFE